MQAFCDAETSRVFATHPCNKTTKIWNAAAESCISYRKNAYLNFYLYEMQMLVQVLCRNFPLSSTLAPHFVGDMICGSCIQVNLRSTVLVDWRQVPWEHTCEQLSLHSSSYPPLGQNNLKSSHPPIRQKRPSNQQQSLPDTCHLHIILSSPFFQTTDDDDDGLAIMLTSSNYFVYKMNPFFSFSPFTIVRISVSLRTVRFPDLDSIFLAIKYLLRKVTNC